VVPSHRCAASFNVSDWGNYYGAFGRGEGEGGHRRAQGIYAGHRDGETTRARNLLCVTRKQSNWQRRVRCLGELPVSAQKAFVPDLTGRGVAFDVNPGRQAVAHLPPDEP
jgi:hypothetical protein